MKDMLKMLLFWAAAIGAFFYFCTFQITETGDYKKIRIETKQGHNGLSVRLKPEGLEIWKTEGRVETLRIYPVQLKTQQKTAD